MHLKNKKLVRLIRIWMVSSLPLEYVFTKSDMQPKSFLKLLRMYYARWIVHPLKRRLAKYYLLILKTFFGLKVIGITGSAGKTTTKEMLASVLSEKCEVVYSFSNIDPIYNIPSTILRCRPQTKYIVLEMGVEYPGEMNFYLWMVGRVDVAIITNIFPTHTEFFKNEKGVFDEKKKLVCAQHKSGIAVLNFKNRYLRSLGSKLNASVLWFNNRPSNTPRNLKFTSFKETAFNLKINGKEEEFRIPILGRQFSENAAAVVIASEALGVAIPDIRGSLSKVEIPDHRMKIIKTKKGALIYDDSYNSNPKALEASIEAFLETSKAANKIVVFGDMLELGKDEKEYHKKIGEKLSKLHINKLVCVGKLAFYTFSAARKMGIPNVKYFNDKNEAIEYVKKVALPNTHILVKGSRSIGLDSLVAKLAE